MVRIGGNQFINCSIPLAFEGRYFIIEHEEPTIISVVLEYEGHPIFEIERNEPVENPLTEVSKSPAGIITVSEKSSGGFLYKVRPGSETSVIFGKGIKGEDTSVSITDKEIRVGTSRFVNNLFMGVGAGIVIHKGGGFSMGAPVPPFLRQTE